MGETLTFSQILNEEKKKDKSICVKIADELNQKGIKITARQIQKYKAGEAIPSYELATEILKVLHSRQSASDLQEILINSKKKRYSRIKSKDINQDEYVGKSDGRVHYRLTLRNKDFNFLEGTGIDNNKSIELINDRISEKYGEDKYAFGRYIVDLINKDMK